MGQSSNFSTSNGYIVFYITCTQNSQSIPSNTSSVTVNMYCKRTNSGYSTYGTGTSYLTINGTQYTAGITTAMTITDSPRLMISKVVTIPHNADGTKTLAMSSDITHSMFDGNAGSYNQVLTTIPRASTVSMSSFTMGASSSAIATAISEHSSTFTYNYTVYCGNTLIKSVNGSDIFSSIALSTAENNSAFNVMKSTDSITVTLYLYTMSGSTQIGATQSATCTAYVPAGNPTVTGLVATGQHALTNSFIKNVTPITFTISGDNGIYGSTIASYKVNFQGVDYSSPATKTFTTGLINGSGATHTATATVTDTRGRTGSVSLNVVIVDYSTPSITSFKCERSIDLAGNLNPMGNYAKLTVVGSVFTLKNGVTEKNTATYRLYGKLKTSGTWTPLTVTVNTGIALNRTNVYANYLATNSYDFKLEVQDVLGNITASQVVMSTGIVALSLSKTGIGVGKIWESGALDVGGLIVPNGGTQTLNITGQDIHVNRPSGWYMGSGCANAPDGGWWYYEVINHNGIWCTYKAVNFNYPSMYIKNQANGVWSGWERFVGGGEVSVPKVANTIVKRDENGYIYSSYINSDRGSENSGAAQYIYDNGDGWMRKKDLANVRAEILQGVGRTPAYTWYGTCASGTNVFIVHNLGYKPIVQFDGSVGNIMLTYSHSSTIQTRITCYPSAFTGYVYLY